ncbi:glutaredoxin 3 [Methylocella sp.]|uniref:glutaredoxin 3 n=1 Tax=Methylocella sp. TaxID=1978226 RepID=UPI003783D65C
MPEITIYTTATCPYCRRAKELLAKKGLPFKEIPVDGEPELRAELAQRAGRTSVPQIFFGAHHVGGCDDLYDLHYDGKIEQLLAEQD